MCHACRLAAFFVSAFVLAWSTARDSFVSRMQPITAVGAALFVLLINTDLLYVQQYEMVAINIIMITTVSLLMDLRFPFVLAVELASLSSYTVFLFARGSEQDYADYLLLVGDYTSAVYTVQCTYVLHVMQELAVQSSSTITCITATAAVFGACMPALARYHKHCTGQHYAAVMLLSMYDMAALVTPCLLADEPVMDHLEDVTIMFSDLKGYTEWCSKHEPMEVYRVLNKVYTAFDRHIEPSGVYKLDTIGDAFVVVAGLDGYKSKWHVTYAPSAAGDYCHTLHTHMLLLEHCFRLQHSYKKRMKFHHCVYTGTSNRTVSARQVLVL
eukprot:13572-Heterococcus_DN1.PRE.1